MLSKDAYKILKLFNEKDSLSDEEIKDFPDDAFSTLEKFHYIRRDSLGYPDGYRAEYSDYHITDIGRAYVQSKSRSAWWIEHWIDFTALIISFLSLTVAIIAIVIAL